MSALAVAWLALPATAQTRAAEEDSGIDLTVEVEVASAYVFRGFNVFGDTQLAQRAAVFPSVTVSAGALSGGYWGAYQLSGDNALQKVYEGFGGETDLWLSYEGSAGALDYSVLLLYYVFPFADEATAGAATPMYLEPGVGVSYSTAVDLGLDVSYFRGLQDATVGLSYLYLRPSVTREIELARSRALELTGALGYKLWTNDPAAEDNRYDVQLDAKVTIPFGGAYVAPAAHVAWTNLAALGFGDELIVWVGVHLGGEAPDIR
ncbi:MAG TPA: TorF family putative porin [Haliangium sp.]|nr:TorF family putative porin [Haliangium sp.]